MTKRDKVRRRILRLRKERDELWKAFNGLPRKESFSGLGLSGKLNKVQQELDALEGSRRSKRYYTEINIEIPG